MEQKKADGGRPSTPASTMWLLRRGGCALRRVPALARGTSSTAKDAVRQKETPMQRALPILFHMEDLARFPDLLKKPVAVHDVPVHHAPSTYGSSVSLFNEEPYFPTPPPSVLALSLIHI